MTKKMRMTLKIKMTSKMKITLKNDIIKTDRQTDQLTDLSIDASLPKYKNRFVLKILSHQEFLNQSFTQHFWSKLCC